MNGKELKQARRAAGISQKHLSKQIGISTSTLSRWESKGIKLADSHTTRIKRLLTAKRTQPPSHPTAPQAIVRDPHHAAIIEALSRRLDPDLFELCAADLLKEQWPRLVPVRGGSDDGYDGAIAQGDGPPIPLISTTSPRTEENLRKNLQRAISKGAPSRAIFATSQRVTPNDRKNLTKAARDLGAKLVQIYEQDWFANALYRRPDWCKKLLGVTGRPSALSIYPVSKRPLLSDLTIGRDETIQKLSRLTGDSLLVGAPGTGKTFLLRHLAMEGRALFLTDENPEAIANAVREQAPESIIVDDAHIDPEVLPRLNQIRRSINADFKIIAVSWPADSHRVSNALCLASTDIIELELIDADTMVEIIKSAGLQGPDILINSIIRQAEGRPGLAVTLAYLCMRGDAARVFTGETIADQLSPILDKLLEAESSQLLGAFSLGGDSGVKPEAVSAFLGMPIHEVSTKLARLATAGVVRDSEDRSISVWPVPFRWILVRNTFFSGPGSLPFEPLAQHVTYHADCVKALIGARARGASIPALESIIEVAKSESLWADYASIGPLEAAHALKRRPSIVIEIAESCLQHIPSITIPLLLKESIGDNRPLHSHIDHPLRKLEDWVADSFPRSKDSVSRRRMLMQAAAIWCKTTKNHTEAIRGMCIALRPNFQSVRPAPGRGNKYKITFGTLDDPEILELEQLWPTLLSAITNIDILPWQSLQDELLNYWVYPQMRGEPSIETRTAMDKVTQRMLQDLAHASAHHPGIQHSIAALSRRRNLNISVQLDSDFETLFPIESGDQSEDPSAKWTLGIDTLARKWEKLSPTEVSIRLSRLESEAKIAGINYPRLTGLLCSKLSKTARTPTTYAEELIRRNIPQDLIAPFFKQAAIHAPLKLNKILDKCLLNNNYAHLAVAFTICAPRLPPSTAQILTTVLRDNPSIAQVIEDCCSHEDVPSKTLRYLLASSENSVSLSAAIGIWKKTGSKRIPVSLAGPWRRAIIHAVNETNHASWQERNNYWLGKILSRDSKLSHDWITTTLQATDTYIPRLSREILLKASAPLSQDQRLRILKLIIGKSSKGAEEFVGELIGEDSDLYGMFLKIPSKAHYHLAPLIGKPVGGWIDRAKLALDAGYTPEKIVSTSLDGMTSWSGPESELWAEWVEDFTLLMRNADARVVEVGRCGQEITQRRMQKCIAEERIEAIRGL